MDDQAEVLKIFQIMKITKKEAKLLAITINVLYYEKHQS
jgi:hypothetical protein